MQAISRGIQTMQTTTLTIDGMRDEQCLRLVTNAIQDLPGIGYLEISLETGQATIEHGAFVSSADIYQAVEDAGFSAR
jgi:copper chaperone CopZ